MFAEEDTGLYIVEFDLDFSGGLFDRSKSSFEIGKLDVDIDKSDNVERSKDGSIFVTSDNDKGGVRRVARDGSVERIARTVDDGERCALHDLSSIVHVDSCTVFSLTAYSLFLFNLPFYPPSAGVLDISELVGQDPGSGEQVGPWCFAEAMRTTVQYNVKPTLVSFARKQSGMPDQRHERPHRARGYRSPRIRVLC